jgi:hypothetical protein
VRAPPLPRAKSGLLSRGEIRAAACDGREFINGSAEPAAGPGDLHAGI